MGELHHRAGRDTGMTYDDNPHPMTEKGAALLGLSRRLAHHTFTEIDGLAWRGSAVEAWIRTRRDRHRIGMTETDEWCVLDDLLDDYRLHADTGTDLREEV